MTSTSGNGFVALPRTASSSGGPPRSICQAVIHWEIAYAKAFQIQTSNDNSTWTTIYSTTTGTGGTQTLNITGSGRYIRMYGTVAPPSTGTSSTNSRSTRASSRPQQT